MWGGFIEGELYTRVYRAEGDGYDEHEHAAIFARHYEARAEFQDVRPVVVTWAASKPKKLRRGKP